MIDDPQQVEQLLKRLRIISAAPRDRHARVGCGHSGAIVRHRSTATMHHHKDVLWRRRRRHPLRARSRQGGARQGGVRRIADPSRLRSRIGLGRRDRSLPEASHRTPATWRSDAFRAWAIARDDTRPAASASVRERAGSGAQDNGGALSGAGGLDGRVLQPAPQRRLCAIGAARCGGAVPQTAEPGVVGATGELGLRDFYALGQVNFLSDKSSTPHMSMQELCAGFGVSPSTGNSKAKAVRTALGIKG